MSLHYLIQQQLPYKIWNAHRARVTIELLQKESAEFMPPQLWHSNSPHLNPVDYSVWYYWVPGESTARVHNTHHWSRRNETVIENGVGRAGVASDQVVIAAAIRCLSACVKAAGGHSEHYPYFCHCTVSDFFVADVEDINSYMPRV